MSNYPAGVTDNDPHFDLPSVNDVSDESEPLLEEPLRFLKNLEDRANKSEYPVAQKYTPYELNRLYRMAGRIPGNYAGDLRQGSYIRSMIDDAREGLGIPR